MKKAHSEHYEGIVGEEELSYAADIWVEYDEDGKYWDFDYSKSTIGFDFHLLVGKKKKILSYEAELDNIPHEWLQAIRQDIERQIQANTINKEPQDA